MFHINFRAQYFITQRIAKDMLGRGGVICNMSSVHGFQGVPEHSVYAATKGAIVAYTRALAVELAHFQPRALFEFLQQADVKQVAVTHMGRPAKARLADVKALARKMLGPQKVQFVADEDVVRF